MATFVLIHGAADTAWYWHLVELGAGGGDDPLAGRGGRRLLDEHGLAAHPASLSGVGRAVSRSLSSAPDLDDGMKVFL